jgi:TatD DNase family protein
MYSDTHFHFQHLARRFGLQGGAELFAAMGRNGTAFGMDIGTRSGDLLPRMETVHECLCLVDDAGLRRSAGACIRFSAGIWPDPGAIRERVSGVAELAGQIACGNADTSLFPGRVAAVGECGLDHHWNSSSAADCGAALLSGERELFAMQLELARRLSLPVVVHSRDAFADTLGVIADCGYDCGVIHCFSYCLDEARAFLDRGWYLAFGGAVTYTKKSCMPDMERLLRYVPADRLLLETDAPYLAPVPLRGTVNTPLNIRLSYEFIASVRGESVEALCAAVDKNCCTLFS